MSEPNSSPSALESHERGVAYFRAGQYPAALKELERAAAASAAAGDKRTLAETANDLGATLQKLKQREAARKQFESALALFAELADDNKRAQALGNLGTLLADMKKYREAERTLEQAAELFHRLGEMGNEAFTLKWLSRVHLRQWDLLGALFAYERALARLEPLPPDQKMLRRLFQIPLRILSRG
jgi:tetratricopeptide (TPR) repeat protein